jgi:hypothetical protein
MGFDIGVNLGPPGYAVCPVELGAVPARNNCAAVVLSHISVAAMNLLF